MFLDMSLGKGQIPLYRENGPFPRRKSMFHVKEDTSLLEIAGDRFDQQYVRV